MSMINLTINGIPCQTPKGTSILQAARGNGIHIPSLCHLKDIHKFGTCRICVVEQVGAKNLQASCMVEAQEGMEIYTHSERVRKARKTLFQLMMSDHNKDCLSCLRNQDCELQALGRELAVLDDPYRSDPPYQGRIDVSESITRDTTKCILCRRCVTVCNQIQGVSVLNAQNRGFDTKVAPVTGLKLGDTNCSYCGQCVAVCPTGALSSTIHEDRVWKALESHKHVIVQTAPAVRVALGECFGLEPGTIQTGRMVAALRQMGFYRVFDTNWAADLTIMEEGTEFLNRFATVLDGGEAALPMITSCSPGWVKFCENHFPEQLDHLSTCKSPHTMMGAVIKHYYAEQLGLKPEDMYVVSVMPCTAKKTEIARPEMMNDGLPNVDAVLTTRELGDMIRAHGINFMNLPEEDFDDPLGKSTGAADIFGTTGGVMEAALRTVYEIITGRELPFPNLHISPIVGMEEIKEATIKLEDVKPEWSSAEGFEVKVAVTSGLRGARKLMEQVKAGTSPYHFIEVMGCPGGCITGGGQPRTFHINEVRKARMDAIYRADEGKPLRKSHENPDIQAFYADCAGEPGGHWSHEYLHTHYVKRGVFNELTDESFVVEHD